MATTLQSPWSKPVAPKHSGLRCRTAPPRLMKRNLLVGSKPRSSTSFSRSLRRTNSLPRSAVSLRCLTRSLLTTCQRFLPPCRPSASRSLRRRSFPTRPLVLKPKQRFAINLLLNLLRSSPASMVPTSNSRPRSARSPRPLFAHAS